MLTISILFKLLSSAVTLRRDKSILYSRTSINLLLYCVYGSFFTRKVVKAIGLFGGLFHATSITKIFHIFFYTVSAIILLLTSYYPRKIWEKLLEMIPKSLKRYKEVELDEEYYEKARIRREKWKSYRKRKRIYEAQLAREEAELAKEEMSKQANEKSDKQENEEERGQSNKEETVNVKQEGKSYLIKKYKSYLLNKLTEQFKILEYSLIILFIISGGVLLMSSTDLISMFLSIELQSYGLYILSTIYKNSEQSTKAGLTYFLLGGLSSCFILLGTGLLYSNTATTNLEGLYLINCLTGHTDLYKTLFIYEPGYIHLSLTIMAVGFLFKVSAAPFHFWSPDVYDAIPTVVTTFVAIVAKISIFIFLLHLLQCTAPQTKNLFTSVAETQLYLCEADKDVYEFSWINCLLVSSFFSLIIGTVLGLTQNRIKRLFAYSTISHLGFILLALSINSIESIQAFLFYLMQYSLTNLNAFFILIAIGYSYCVNVPVFSWLEKHAKNFNIKDLAQNYELLDKKNSPIQFINQVKGLFYLNPALTLSLTVTIFSFVGIPPLIGFFGKQMVLSAALDSGYYFLALVAILTSVISAVYYLNIIKEMYFFPHTYFGFTGLETDEKLGNIKGNIPGYITSFNIESLNSAYSETDIYKQDRSKLVLSNYLTITISVLTLGILLFIFVPKQWLSMANILALNLFNT